MARVVFDSFEPNNACFESPAIQPSDKNTDNCEVTAVFHAEGSSGYDPSQPPTVYFKRRGTEFFLNTSTLSSVSVGLLRGLGFENNDPSIQSKIYYAIGLSDALKHLYEKFIKSKDHPLAPFIDLVSQYKNFIITGNLDSSDPITKLKTAALLEAILNASDDALDFINKLNASFKDPQSNQSRILPEMMPKIEWLAALIRINIDLRANLNAMKEISPSLHSRSEKWIKQLTLYLGMGSGNSSALFEELKKLCDIYGEQGNIPSEYKNFAAVIKQTLAVSYDIGNVSKSGNVQWRWSQISTQLMGEEMRFSLNQAAESGALQKEVEKELREAKLPKSWLEDKERIKEITEAVFSGARLFLDDSKKISFRIEVSHIESAVRKMVAQHGVQEREYIIGTLAALRFLKSQGKKAFANKDLDIYEQKLIKKLSSSVKKTNVILPIIEAGVCMVGGVLAGSGGGIQNRPLTLTGSTITGLGCSALVFHFIPSRNDYIKDPLVGLLGAAGAFTAAWFATQNMEMPPPMLMGRDDKNPVTGWGP